METKQVQHAGLSLTFIHTEKGWHQTVFNPEAGCKDRVPVIPRPNFQLAVAGQAHGAFSPSQVTGYTTLPLEMTLNSTRFDENDIVLIYQHAALALDVTVEMQLAPGAAVIRQVTSVTNRGEQAVTLTHFSSACFEGLATDGLLPWHDSRKIRVHYCLQTWEGEGQWRTGTLEDLGLYPESVHPSATSVNFSSVGGYSTSRMMPMIVMEDLETGKVWYGQIETSTQWQIELGHHGSWSDDSGSLYLQLDAASERVGGWRRILQPGETFTSVPAAVGCCLGGFTEAVRELTRYRRAVLKPPAAWDGDACPVIFNDYMNCLWGNPSREKLLPLIDASAAAGVEVFMIDAGWFNDLGVSWGLGLGVWQPSRDRFGEGGLKGILDTIRAKGMIPGLWLEMDVCSVESALVSRPDDWFLRRAGARVVGGGGRLFLNFTHPEVRAYLHETIDRLVRMEVGYFKNDYNAEPGNGDDVIGSTAPDGLDRNVRAFYDFIDEVRSRHPRLILENCGGGANRQDYGILSHFHLQSSSDQEIYTLYPSILAGSLAVVLPEQLGIWAYPYPLLFLEMGKPEILFTEAYRAKMADGEQTIFNMVNGLCGNLYLSGRLDAMDKTNCALVAEGVSLYRSERAFIQQAFPFWPLGFNRIPDEHTWACVGLESEDRQRALLAVWRLGSDQEWQTIPLPAWQGKLATVRQVYPEKGYEVPAQFHLQPGTLTVRFSKPWSARYFLIEAAG
jgi:alpha-galactosidase